MTQQKCSSGIVSQKKYRRVENAMPVQINPNMSAKAALTSMAFQFLFACKNASKNFIWINPFISLKLPIRINPTKYAMLKQDKSWE